MFVIAIVPGIFEELAFRGVILTGLQKDSRPSSAIFVSAFFFGITHGILQQSLNAFIIGLLLGYIAVRCGSLIPTIIMHVLHNGITVLVARSESQEWLSLPYRLSRHSYVFSACCNVRRCNRDWTYCLVPYSNQPKLAVGKSQYAGD